jgi:alpha-mannosidase
VHEIAAVGHAHIDTAWLWPLEVTYRKGVRTFAAQVRLMERHRAYRFACSQSQQYARIHDGEPELWNRIQAQIAAERWLPVGGT